MGTQEANLGDIFFTLSVNFLLYTTLIIVFYMLVRFYFEEDFSINDNTNHSSNTSLETAGLLSEENEEKEKRKLEMKQSGIELLDLESSTSSSPFSTSTSSRPNTFSSNISHFLSIHEWSFPTNSIEHSTKQEVLQMLLLCSVGLIFTFSIWGLVQERILTIPYNGDMFTYSYGLVFLNRLGGFLISYSLMKYLNVPWYPSALYEYSIPSVANIISSWCQYEALKYVSFPVVMLAKAFKMVPVMLMGKIMNNKSYELYEYICGGMVGFGLYLFLSTSEDSSPSNSEESSYFFFGESKNSTICGAVLLLLFLCFDSFTGQWQTRTFNHNPALSPLQMMLIMNAFSMVFSFITLIHSEEFFSSLLFVYQHPHMLLHIAIFCITSTIGQLFIFFTVKHFGAVVFSIIMSLRIVSCFFFHIL